MEITFSREWNKRTIRSLVTENCYLRFGDHEDLKALCICPFDEEDYKADYEELTYVVPSNWLKQTIKELFDVDDVDTWLREEYTSDESEIVFEKALTERQVVMVDF